MSVAPVSRLLDWTVPDRTVPGWAMLDRAGPCHAVPEQALPCQALPCLTRPCHAALCRLVVRHDAAWCSAVRRGTARCGACVRLCISACACVYARALPTCRFGRHQCLRRLDLCLRTWLSCSGMGLFGILGLRLCVRARVFGAGMLRACCVAHVRACMSAHAPA